MKATKTTIADGGTPAQSAEGQYLSLTEVAKIAPGRPSTNCVWRWCRRGVLSRGGDRVRLRHVRIGGMIYTTAGWLAEFGQCLADADARYFDLCDAAADDARARARRDSRAPRRAARRDRHHRGGGDEELDRELRAEGL